MKSDNTSPNAQQHLVDAQQGKLVFCPQCSAWTFRKFMSTGTVDGPKQSVSTPDVNETAQW